VKRVVVIGGGAAGLMAAYRAGAKGHSVLVVERNERPARKILVTGKGRCNLTNNCDNEALIANVPKNPRFLYSAFSSFNTKDTMDFFEKEGVPLKTERGNRVFPVSDKAMDIADALVSAAKKQGVKFKVGRATNLLVCDGEIKGIILEDGSEILADAVVIATGGKSYSRTGSTGDGYLLASSVGHTVTEISPSLVPLKIYEGFCSDLMGLSLKNVKLTIFEEGTKKPIYSEMGEMLFTHFGISGPIVLSASAHMRRMGKKEYKAVIDLKPALDIQTLDSRLQRDFNENSNKDFINALDKLLPQRLIPVVVKLSKIDKHTKVNQITKQQRQQLIEIIKGISLTVIGFRDIEEAIITSGGVSVKEINPATMESKIISNLYFAGEVIDVDAYTGGFNLQIAFSTGNLAGGSI